jgi:phenylalanyl-tRNA synthetase beta chain
MQRRLKYVGMRPISNIVDVTNYVMLEFGEPLHAFDTTSCPAGGRDVASQHKASQHKAPTIITRLPGRGSSTLDGVERDLDPFTILVRYGRARSAWRHHGRRGVERIVDASTTCSMLRRRGGREKLQHGRSMLAHRARRSARAASWNFINIRKTLQAQRERGKGILRGRGGALQPGRAS